MQQQQQNEGWNIYSSQEMYKKLDKLVPGIKNLEAGDKLTLKAEGKQDVIVEVLLQEGHSTEITLKQENPKLTIGVFVSNDQKGAEALTWSDGKEHLQVYYPDETYDPHAMEDLSQKLNTQLNNLKGYTLEGQQPVKGGK